MAEIASCAACGPAVPTSCRLPCDCRWGTQVDVAQQSPPHWLHSAGPLMVQPLAAQQCGGKAGGPCHGQAAAELRAGEVGAHSAAKSRQG